MKIIRINKGKAYSLPIRLILLAIITSLVIVVFQNVAEPWSILLSISLSVLLPAFWFATKLIVIDNNNKIVFDGIWMMGFKIGKNHNFKSIDQLRLEKVKTAQKVYSLDDGKNILTNHEYQAQLKTDSNATFYLFSHPMKERAEEKMTKIRKKLGL